MAEALLGDRTHYTGLARSEIYRWFTDPTERSRYLERDRDWHGRALVAHLRVAYGTMGPRSEAGQLVRALRKASAEFSELWDQHQVALRFADHKTIIHPELGPIELDCQILFTEDQSQMLLVFTAYPRTEAYEKLQLLAVLGQQHFPETQHIPSADPH
jgi:MmyB-like transcription regulator ligand binding domain